jgi:branched-subunit amino acid ABC-type transport system permease component
MPEGSIIAVTTVVLVGVTAYLIGSLARSIARELRRSNLRKIWKNFGLSLAFCGLFLVSWTAQAIAEWGSFRTDQIAHGEPVAFGDFVIEFGQSTLENWQSEFLQLFSFVVLSALLIHRGSGESKDSADRMEQKIDEIAKRLDELAGGKAPVVGR